MTMSEIYARERMSGLSATQVAEKYGIARQAVCSMSKKYMTRNFRGWRKDNCIYVNLRNFLNENLYSMDALKAELNLNCKCPASVIRNFLEGHNSATRKSTIDAFLNLTGFKYAQLFEEG